MTSKWKLNKLRSPNKSKYLTPTTKRWRLTELLMSTTKRTKSSLTPKKSSRKRSQKSSRSRITKSHAQTRNKRSPRKS